MKSIVGIDEVGRGPLAGPVTLCTVLCEENLYKKLKRNKNLPLSGKDSKKLSANQRKKYSIILKDLKKEYKNREIFDFYICSIDNKKIDKKGISFCINLAIEKCLKKLKVKNDSKILLDGGLKVPKEFIFQKTIIKGDEKEKIIAWASILAKVNRDDFMNKIHKKFSQYGFDVNKGYGTKKHREAILKNGLSPVHRKNFCSKI